MTFQMDRFIYKLLCKEAKKNNESMGESIRVALDYYFYEEVEKRDRRERAKETILKERYDSNKKEDTNNGMGQKRKQTNEEVGRLKDDRRIK